MTLDFRWGTTPVASSWEPFAGQVNVALRQLNRDLQTVVLTRSVATPAQITGNQNDYPIGSARVVRLSTDASRNITGLRNAGGGGNNVANAELTIINVGSQNIVLQHQNAGSVAANRFLLEAGADLTLGANDAVTLYYDLATARWRNYALPLSALAGTITYAQLPTGAGSWNTGGGLITITNTLTVSGLLTASNGITVNGSSPQIIVYNAASNGQVYIRGDAGKVRDVVWGTGSGDSPRWIARTEVTAESGSNAGSNFQFIARDDSGVQIDVPWSITRAAGGTMTIARPATITGLLTASAGVRSDAGIGINVAPLANGISILNSGTVMNFNVPLNTFGTRIIYQNNGTDKWYLGARADDSDNFELVSTNSGSNKRTYAQQNGNWNFPAAATISGLLTASAGIVSTQKITTYNNVATVGWGVPSIYGTGRSTGQTGDVASVATYTVGAADGSFLISCNVLVTTYVAGTQSIKVDYTDEGGTARTLTLTTSSLGGTLGITVGAAGPAEGIAIQLRCKASTSITIKTVGSLWNGTYNVEGSIMQIT